VKSEYENLPDIGEAWIAAKEFNGPVDPALVKLKHRENVKAAEEVRNQEVDPRGRRSLARDDPDRDRKDREHQTRTLTWLLANNPAYARVHTQTFDALRNAEDAAAEALAKLEAAHAKAERGLQDMLDHAARLPDGRRVFKDQRGQVRDEHGARVSELEAASIQWRGDEPAWENFEDQRTYAGELSRGIDEMRGVQVDLGDIREEMADKDHPPSETRVGELRGQIEDLDRKTQENLSIIQKKEPVDLEISARVATATMPLPPG
jgi:hypothetical protein